MRIFLGVLASALFLIVVLSLIPLPSSPSGDVAIEGLPWQIEPLGDGRSRVFGLTLGSSTLADARARFGADGELAVVTAPGEEGSLEMYYSDVVAGAVSGRLILTGDLPATTLAAMRERASKVDYMQSSTRKASLADGDVGSALRAPIAAIAFIPAARLDEAIVLQRFGQPDERIRTSETVEHFLYAARGLDLALDSDGKEVLQYVAPARFAAVRQPLISSTKPATPKP